MKGFTFIEIILVVVILTIIASLAVPYYLSFYRRQQLSATTQEIVQTLRKAQAKSMAGEDNSEFGVYFYLNSVSNEYYYDFFKYDEMAIPPSPPPLYDPPDNIAECQSDPALDCYVLPSSLKIISCDFGSDNYHSITTVGDNCTNNVNYITFKKINGTTYSTNPYTFTVGYDNNLLESVSINPLGIIDISE